jgi:NADPH:quinone reductase-like Zn-dependent oxidoreductase
MAIRGHYRPPNDTDGPPAPGVLPGYEGVGVIEAVGPGTEAAGQFSTGTRVAFFPVRGTWCDRIIAATNQAVAVPENIEDSVAAQLHVNPLAAILLARAVSATSTMDSSGEPVLLSAAGSCVAKLAAALLRQKGFSPIGLVRSASSAASLSSLLDMQVVATEHSDWQHRIRNIAGRRPIRIALDAVGGSLASEMFALLADGGSLICYGDLSGQPISAPALFFSLRGKMIGGIALTRWMALPKDAQTADVAAALELVRDNRALLPVAAEYDFDHVAEAVRHAERAGRVGTVILRSGGAVPARSIAN